MALQMCGSKHPHLDPHGGFASKNDQPEDGTRTVQGE